MKRIALMLLACSALSLTGCVTVTSDVEGEEVIGYTEGQPVSGNHDLAKAVSVGRVEGFTGTSIFPILGRVSPDMDNAGVRFALQQTLSNAGMLAPEQGRFVLSATFVGNNEEGASGNTTGLLSVAPTINRTTDIRYVLVNARDQTVYDNVVHSEGGEYQSYVLPYYLNEKRAAVPSYRNNFTQLIEELKAVGDS